MAQDVSDSDATACPVNHKSRAAWLEQARDANHKDVPDAPPETSKAAALDPASKPAGPKRRSPWLSFLPLTSQTPPEAPRLGKEREISTIPRVDAAAASGPAAGLSASTASHDASACPANHENESGADAKSGNWIYPSEEMFFNAMRRKNHDPRAEDMRSIVPIHNAVNERAWKEIKAWEKGQGSEQCGGPKLVSFSGDSSALTPRARWNSLVGFAKPFDRHDWAIDRCGTRIDYVIDFYAGKDEKREGKSLNFYLDVRPKLNSWEGFRMRAYRALGL